MKKITALKAIRLKCLDCMCDSAHEVRKCIDIACPLYVYRLGKDPTRKGRGGNPTALREFHRKRQAGLYGKQQNTPSHTESVLTDEYDKMETK